MVTLLQNPEDPARLKSSQFRVPGPGEIIVVHTPGGGHKFYEEFGPAAMSGPPDPNFPCPLFAKHDMTLLGSPLSPD